MKTTEKDYEYLETSPEAAAAGLRRITRPKSLEARLRKKPQHFSLRDCKTRITIYLDADIVIHFQEFAEKEGTGYQTLINNTLRRIVDKEQKEAEKEDLKNDLLKDKQFLRKLKTALSV